MDISGTKQSKQEQIGVGDLSGKIQI